MGLKDQFNMVYNAPQSDFLQRVVGAWIHACNAVFNEVANEVQSISITGGPTGGTFTVSYGGQTTGAINWNATAAQVQTALGSLSSIGAANVVCTGGPLPGTAVAVTFTGSLGNQPLNLMSLGVNSLTGGATPAPAFSRTTVGVSFYNHANRAAKASFYLNAPSAQWQYEVGLAIADNATVQTDFPAPNYTRSGGVTDAAADSDVQFQANAVFPGFVG